MDRGVSTVVVAASGGGEEGKPPQVRDYAIPRKGQRLAILRLEFPVSEDDVEKIGKWLELMKSTIVG